MSLKISIRNRIYKDEDIYVCVACDGMYTIEMIDAHLETCKNMDAFLAKRAADAEEEEEDESSEEDE